jgi:hypothetical protein
MSVEHPLKHPITQTFKAAGGQAREETLTEITLRRIQGGDIRWMERMANKPGLSLGLIGRLAQLDEATVDKLDAEDIADISEVIEGFLPDSLKTGPGKSLD